MTFTLSRWRFVFKAVERLYFPAGTSGNTFRGALGLALRALACAPACEDTWNCSRRSECAYARIFQPVSSDSGPSGLSYPPRPFVLRACHLDGYSFQPDDMFHVDVHLFRAPAFEDADWFVEAFRHVGLQGLGTGRGRADLLDASGEDVTLSLLPPSARIERLRIHFLSPTELKENGVPSAQPEFATILRRARDRIGTLRALYGEGPLPLDFQGMGERAGAVRTVRYDVHMVNQSRRSSRTGQTHSVGGFVGTAEYEGNLTEFVPFLHAAEWTGLGRQTTWGKGQIETIICPASSR